MTGLHHAIWLPLSVFFYAMVMLYWVRVSIAGNRGADGFFSASHGLPPWLGALVTAGVSLTGWFVLGGTQLVARDGFTLPVLVSAGVLLALPGVIFFKRLWFAAERLHVSSLADVFRLYYGSPFLVVVTTAIAVLFALGFSGLQVRMLSGLVETMTGGAVSELAATTIFGFILFAGVGIGGMRSIGYFGVIQTVLVLSAIVFVAGFAVVSAGGFEPVNARLLALSLQPETARLFSVGKVIEFTAGLGRGGDYATSHTALANLSLAFALMGFQASPLVFKILFSTRRPSGVAAGQIWVTAGFLGALIAGGIMLTGAVGLVDDGFSIVTLFQGLHDRSPWFAAWMFIGVAAGVQLLAGLSLFAAAEGLVRHVYRPYFHSALSKAATVTITRIAIAILAVLAMILQTIAPVTLSALAALALPLAFQLWTPLLGVSWLGWITRQAAATGVGFGIAGVLLTEPLGYQVLSFFGLELPWGRWPWTIHSALWGMAANLAAVLIISAITNRTVVRQEAAEIRALFSGLLAISPKARDWRSFAWSIVIAWFFLAAGPGLIFGNTAFVSGEGETTVWLLGMPSLWAWGIAGWVSGLGMIWFLAYRMEMANPSQAVIPAYTPPLKLRRNNTEIEQERLRILFMAGAIVFVLAVLAAFIFSR